jgi:ABC-type dipeptide/oligopeptide/nickel transport system ATPase component
LLCLSYGVCVEKALLLAGEPTQILEVQLSADSILDRIEQLGQQLKPANVISEQPALVGA